MLSEKKAGDTSDTELSHVLPVSSENECGHLDALQGIQLPFVNT